MRQGKRSGIRAERLALRHAIRRCTLENHIAWPAYGGRGITVSTEWNTPDFEIGLLAFLDHIGPRPSDLHSLDRIDNDQGYHPGNVRWADRTEQQRNRRPTSLQVQDYGWGLGRTRPKGRHGVTTYPSLLIEHDGKRQTVSEWSEQLGLKPATIRQRAQRGWPTERILAPFLFTPHNQPRR